MPDWIDRAAAQAFEVEGFQFDSGERMDLRLYCRTLGPPASAGDNVVLMLHGTAGSDVAESDRGTPGTGQTAWPAVMQALRDIRYDGWCVIESFAWDKPALAAATRSWRDLARSPDELVRDGLRFLRATHESTARSEQAP